MKELERLVARLSSGSPAERADAARSLEAFLPDSLEPLRQALSQPALEVRIAAAVVLSRSTADLPAALAALRAALAEDARSAAAVFVALREARVPASEFRADIVAAIHGSDDRSRALCSGLGEVADWAGAEVVAVGLDENRDTRRAAAGVLTTRLPIAESALAGIVTALDSPAVEFRITNRFVEELVTRSRERDGRIALQERILTCIDKLKDETRKAQSTFMLVNACHKDPPLVQMLMKTAFDSKSTLGQRLFSDFGAADAGPAEIEQAMKHLESGADAELHRRALWFFRNDGSGAVPALLKVLRTSSGSLGSMDWEMAGSGLLHGGAAGCAALAKFAVEDSRPEARKMLLKWLAARIETEDDVVPRALLPVLADANVRTEALAAIQVSGPRAACAVKPLLDLLPADASVLPALRRIGVRKQEDADRLLEWAKKNPKCAGEVAECLLPATEAARTAALDLLKKEPDSSPRTMALLGELGGDKVVAALRSQLSAKKIEVRVAAARALGRIGPAAAAAVPDFEKAISTPVGDARELDETIRFLLALGPTAKSSTAALQKIAAGNFQIQAAHARIALWALGAEPVDNNKLRDIVFHRQAAEDRALLECLWDLPAPNAALAALLKERMAGPEGNRREPLYMHHLTDAKEIDAALDREFKDANDEHDSLEARIISGIKVEQALEKWSWRPTPSNYTCMNDIDLRLVEAIGKLAATSPPAIRQLLRMAAARDETGYRALGLLQKYRKE